MGFQAMPKSGLTPSEWESRLREFAAGSFKFKRGQRPGKGSAIAIKLAKIERCQLQGRPAATDPFGRQLTCLCGYHRVCTTQRC